MISNMPPKDKYKYSLPKVLSIIGSLKDLARKDKRILDIQVTLRKQEDIDWISFYINIHFYLIDNINSKVIYWEFCSISSLGKWKGTGRATLNEYIQKLDRSFAPSILKGLVFGPFKTIYSTGISGWGLLEKDPDGYNIEVYELAKLTKLKRKNAQGNILNKKITDL